LSTGQNSEAEARSFAETRRTLLDALDRTEQEAHDQAAELISLAERRAREISIKADQSAALVEEQLAYLSAQLDHVRSRVTDIRTRLAQELQAQADRRTPIPRGASQPRSEPHEAPAAEHIAPASMAAPVAPQVDPGGTENDSLPETLRVLRAALESLNGQPVGSDPHHS
jgi:hypothetical protein